MRGKRHRCLARRGPFAPRTYLQPILLSASATSFSTPTLSETADDPPEEEEPPEDELPPLEDEPPLEDSFVLEGAVGDFLALEE